MKDNFGLVLMDKKNVNYEPYGKIYSRKTQHQIMFHI